jgi:hypothetical protein
VAGALTRRNVLAEGKVLREEAGTDKLPHTS